MDEFQQLQLESTQAYFLAREGDPFWGEGDPDTPGRTPRSVLADIKAVAGGAPGLRDDVRDALAYRWNLPPQKTELDLHLMIMRHVRVARICQELITREISGERWGAVPDLDSEAGDVAARATAQALQDMRIDARGALQRQIPPHLLLEFWRDDLLAAIGAHVADLPLGQRMEFQRWAATTLVWDFDLDDLAAHLQMSPEHVMDLAAEHQPDIGLT